MEKTNFKINLSMLNWKEFVVRLRKTLVGWAQLDYWNWLFLINSLSSTKNANKFIWLIWDFAIKCQKSGGEQRMSPNKVKQNEKECPMENRKFFKDQAWQNLERLYSNMRFSFLCQSLQENNGRISDFSWNRLKFRWKFTKYS